MDRKPAKGLLACVAFAAIIFASGRETRAAEGDTVSGKALFKRDCTICHGEEGKGDGPAARFLYPKPRDFTSGIYKIRSTYLPTDEDLYQTISKGIPGTLMPAFAHLSPKERWDLVVYVKSFSEKFSEAGFLESIPVPDPPPQTPELIAAGEQFYKDFECLKCHGPRGKGDGPSAATLKDVWGVPIIPYDFTIPGKMKRGSTAKDIYRTLAAGIGGTPMPSYGEPATEEEEQNYWALAYYVLSLASEAPQELALADPSLGKELFIGTTRFQNGGAPCIACHSVGGIGALGGGVLGPELTIAYSKFGEERLATILTDLPFPVMNTVFSKGSLTPEERANLISFFRSAAVTHRPTEAVGQLALLALGGAMVLFAMAHLLWRRRLRGVRRPLVRSLA
ncbi:MAG: c-type cytochrome [Candidatus Latescibacteria bacterium]|nr:c-type cytochrome [Candidatus Latescibacterota bacterium]